MRDQNIIMVANQPWEMANNCRNISIELAKSNRILHVNPPLDRKTYYRNENDPYVKKLKRVISGEDSPLEEIQDNIWVLHSNFIAESINSIPLAPIHDFLNRINNRKLAKSIASALKRLNFTQPIVFNDNVIMRAFYLKEMLKPKLFIYYIRDYLVTQSYYKKHGTRLEKILLKNSDMVVANSVYLKEYAEQFNSNSHYVGQGCEIDIFNPDVRLPRPAEMIGITTPIIGYVGYLTSLRLDIALIEYIATHRKDWTIMLVGPENEGFKQSNLHKIKNIVFTGSKPPSELPRYVQYFNVCINPQLVNELTIGNYPRKIDEYLAMGKPTVATKTKAMEVFDGYCYLATSNEEYIQMIELGLKENSEEKRRSRITLARSHNWTENVAGMCSVIEDHLPAGIILEKA